MACVLVKLLPAVIAVLSLTAAVLLMLPAEFRRTGSTETTARIGFVDNVWCKIPSPNMNMSQGELHQHWKVPSTARLSPRMTEIGRCAVAAKKLRRKPEQCYCFGSWWWVPVMAMISLLMAVFCGITCFLRLVCVTRNEQAFSTAMGTTRYIQRQTQVELIHSIIFGLTLLLVSFNLDDQMTYTEYGRIFPTVYFDQPPSKWLDAFWLFLTASCLQLCNFCFYAIFGHKIGDSERHTLITKIVMRMNKDARRATTTTPVPTRIPPNRNIEESKKTPSCGKWPSSNRSPPPPVVIKMDECKFNADSSTESDSIIIPNEKEQGPPGPPGPPPVVNKESGKEKQPAIVIEKKEDEQEKGKDMI